MFHPGKIVEIFSANDKNIVTPDNGVQAMLEMWDDNLITVSVEPYLSKNIKKDDVVLVDYTATQHGAPRMVVVKILRGELAKRTWNNYKDHYAKRRTRAVSMPKIKKEHPYVG
ncbi:MAG: hypothetical protein V1802_03255 [Candidatus Aenigmatarchaeota archaeon]